MKTFKQFITEGNVYSVKDLVRVVNEECEQFLNEIDYEIDDYVLYRGMYLNSTDAILNNKEYGAAAFKRNVRKDRKPLDTPREISNIIDEWFEEKFKVKYRSSGLFCVGKKSLAQEYGRAFAIFPIGKMTYCWSSKYVDLFSDNTWFNLPKDPNEMKERIIKTLDEGGYQHNQLQLALEKYPRNEIMVNCDSYYAIDYEYFHSQFVPAFKEFS